jgi:DNA-binding LacI/PurR family transcriptional regulator
VTKIDKFTRLLEKEIKDGVYPPGSKFPSDRTLAKRFEISSLTVNKAIGILVSQGLLKRHAGRRGTEVLAQGGTVSSRTVGLIINTSMENHAPFAMVLPPVLQREGCYVSVFSNNDHKSLKKNLPRFLSEKPMALVVEATLPLMEWFWEIEIPEDVKLIFIRRKPSSYKFREPQHNSTSYLYTDEFDIGYRSVKHLLELGKRRIAVLSFELRQEWLPNLYWDGCMKAFEEAGLEPCGYFDERASEAEFEKIFAQDNFPDGVVSSGDFRSVKLINALRKIKRKVPEEVAILSFFNTPWAFAYDLTSVSLCEWNIAEKVAEAINSDKPVTEKMQTDFVFRGSCPKIIK